MDNKFICPVCGFDQLKEPAYGQDGEPSYQICPCCGFEFGFDDGTKSETFISYREKWIKTGALWFNQKLRPQNWSIDAQLENIPKSKS